MDDGIIQFFVISLFVVFSILESVARKNKAKAARKDAPPAPDAVRSNAPREPSSEGLAGLISQEFWQEVAALADDDDRDPELEFEDEVATTLPIRAVAAEPVESHWETGLRQARSHDVIAYQDTVPTKQHRTTPASAPEGRQQPARGGRSLRAGLLGSSLSDLRRAVLLYEVLGPPIALRDEARGRNG